MASVYNENVVVGVTSGVWGHKTPSSQFLPGFIFREAGRFPVPVSTVDCLPLTSQFTVKLCEAGTQKQHPTLNLLPRFS